MGLIGDGVLRRWGLLRSFALPEESVAGLRACLLVRAGLTTEEIAHGFHVPASAVAQRIVRAKRTLKAQCAEFACSESDVGARLPAVLDVIYLIFNEGYLVSSGETLTRSDLAAEAYRLIRMVTELVPGQADTWALRALLSFQLAASRACRVPRHGPAFEQTRWDVIVGIYDELLEISGTPVVALNRAVAVAMLNGPAAALPLLDRLADDPALAGSHRVWAVRADLHRRLADAKAASADYDRALELVTNETERRYLAAARHRLSAQ